MKSTLQRIQGAAGIKAGMMAGRTAMIVAFAALAPGLAMATPPGGGSETITARVSVADLDLTTAAGLQIARERLAIMARHLCAAFRDDRLATARQTYFDCTRDTTAAALARLESTTPVVRTASQGQDQSEPYTGFASRQRQ